MDVTRVIGRRRRGQQAVLVANFKIERIQVGEIKPVNVVTECPTLGARGPDPISGAAHRHLAIELPGQDPVHGENAGWKDSPSRRYPGDFRPVTASGVRGEEPRQHRGGHCAIGEQPAPALHGSQLSVAARGGFDHLTETLMPHERSIGMVGTTRNRAEGSSRV